MGAISGIIGYWCVNTNRTSGGIAESGYNKLLRPWGKLVSETQPKNINRRRVVAAAAWSVPAVAVATAAPAFAASTNTTIKIVNAPISTDFGAKYPNFQVLVSDKNGKPLANERVTVTLNGPGRFGSATSSTRTISGTTNPSGILVLDNVYASKGETGMRDGTSEQGPISVIASLDTGRSDSARLSRNVDVSVHQDAPTSVFDLGRSGYQVITSHVLPPSLFLVTPSDILGLPQLLPTSSFTGGLVAGGFDFGVIGGDINVQTKQLEKRALNASPRMNVHMNQFMPQLLGTFKGRYVVPDGYVDTNPANNTRNLRCSGWGLSICTDQGA